MNSTTGNVTDASSSAATTANDCSILYSATNWCFQDNYNIQMESSQAIVAASIVGMTQYVVTCWTLGKESNARPLPHWISSTIVTWILYTLCFNWSNSYATAGMPIGYLIAIPALVFGGIPLHLFVNWLWEKVTKNSSNDDGDEDIDRNDETFNEDNVGNDVEAQHHNQEPTSEPQQQKPQPKPKVHYINNIKIFLTHMVIMLHAEMFVGSGLSLTNQNSWGYLMVTLFNNVNNSYFMPLFVFYSGYFVPKSFDKKGALTFYQERIKRIGIPFVVNVFFITVYINTGVEYLMTAAVSKGASLANEFAPTIPAYNHGVTWFLSMLIHFNILYMFVCKKNWSPKIKCPTLVGFFLISLLNGLITAILKLFFPNDSFFGYEEFWPHITSFLMMFFGGAIAQRNNWMDDLKEKRSRIVIYAWAVVSVLLLFAFDYFYFMTTTGWFADHGNFTSFLQWFLTSGFAEMGLSLAVTVFFMDFVNDSYWCTKFYSVSFYTAYIIQWPVITFAFGIWNLIAESTSIVSYGTSGETIYTNGGMIFVAWLFVSALSFIIVWPLAYGIRSIPGFSRVL